MAEVSPSMADEWSFREEVNALYQEVNVKGSCSDQTNTNYVLFIKHKLGGRQNKIN